MVKVLGPMFSLHASGTLAGAVTYSSWKGRPYVRERVIPSNPRSGPQVGRRTMLRFLAERWIDCAGAKAATWQDLADELTASTFNAFVSQNLKDWHNFLAPAQEVTALRTVDPSDRAISAAAWEENRIKISSTATTANDRWGLLIYASTTGAFTPAVSDLVIARKDATLDPEDDFWTPPEVTTWYFKSMTTSTDGKISAASGQQTAAPP